MTKPLLYFAKLVKNTETDSDSYAFYYEKMPESIRYLAHGGLSADRLAGFIECASLFLSSETMDLYNGFTDAIKQKFKDVDGNCLYSGEPVPVDKQTLESLFGDDLSDILDIIKMA